MSGKSLAISYRHDRDVTYEIWKECISHLIAQHIEDEEEEKENKEKMTMTLLKLQLAGKDTEASKHRLHSHLWQI